MKTTHLKSLGALGGLTLAAGLGLSGCSDEQPPAPPAPVEAEEATPEDGSAITEEDTTGVTINATQAVDRALEEVADGVVVSLELDRDDDAQRWEVDVVDESGAGTQLDIVGGDITEQESFDPDEEELEPHTVLAREAIERAEDEVSAAVVDLKIEREDGALVWEVELLADDNTEHELRIDANSGDLTRD